MARPITWQNIQGPDPRAAIAPMAVASRTLNDAFSGFRDTLNEHQTGVRDRNTEAFLNALSRYQTPEDLQGAMQSGAVDQLRQSFGSMIHQDQARGAADARLGTLMDTLNRYQTHQDGQAVRDSRGAVNAILGRAAQGDVSALSEVQNNPALQNHPEAAEILKTALGFGRTYTETTAARDQNTRAAALHPEKMREAELVNALRQNSVNEATQTQNRNSLVEGVERALWGFGQEEQAGRASSEETNRRVQTLKNSLIEGGVTPSVADALVEAANPQLTSGSNSYGTQRAEQAATIEAGTKFMDYLAKEPERREAYILGINDALKAANPSEKGDDINFARNAIQEFLNQEFKSSGGVTVEFPLWAVQEAIQEAPEGVFSEKAWGNNIKRILQRKAKSPRVVQAMEDQARVNAHRAGATLQEVLRPFIQNNLNEGSW